MKLLLEIRTLEGETLLDRYVKIDVDNVQGITEIVQDMVDTLKEE